MRRGGETRPFLHMKHRIKASFEHDELGRLEQGSEVEMTPNQALTAVQMEMAESVDAPATKVDKPVKETKKAEK